jgi:hypothetical protein
MQQFLNKSYFSKRTICSTLVKIIKIAILCVCLDMLSTGKRYLNKKIHICKCYIRIMIFYFVYVCFCYVVIKSERQFNRLDIMFEKEVDFI